MKFDTFTNPKVLKVGNLLFYLLLLAILIGDFFVTRHEGFAFEKYYWFFAAFGFIASVLAVYVAKILRFFTKRKEDYYDR